MLPTHEDDRRPPQAGSLAGRRLVEQCRAMQQSEPQRHRPRRSGCADAALRAEVERVRRMTVEERIKAALSMHQRFSWLQQVKQAEPDDVRS